MLCCQPRAHVASQRWASHRSLCGAFRTLLRIIVRDSRTFQIYLQLAVDSSRLARLRACMAEFSFPAQKFRGVSRSSRAAARCAEFAAAPRMLCDRRPLGGDSTGGVAPSPSSPARWRSTAVRRWHVSPSIKVPLLLRLLPPSSRSQRRSGREVSDPVHGAQVDSSFAAAPTVTDVCNNYVYDTTSSERSIGRRRPESDWRCSS